MRSPGRRPADLSQLRRRLSSGIVAVAVAASAATAIMVVGCGSTAPGRPLSLPRSLAPSKRSHLAVIVLENREASEVIGNPEAPYLNSLAKRYAIASSYYAIAHPSLPNYLALTGGSTFRIESDCTSCSVSGSSIVDQLEAAHISWRAYMEGLPSACDLSAQAGGYAKKHDPFLYYRSVVSDPRRCRHIVPYPQIGSALRAGDLPTFVWITPNLCDDGHDCALGSVDRFLRSIVPALLSQLGERGALLITWDEGSSGRGCCGGLAKGGRVATILAGPDARRGAVVKLQYDHYSLLRTTEDMLGLAHLRLAGSRSTRPLDALFQGGRPPAIAGG